MYTFHVKEQKIKNWNKKKNQAQTNIELYMLAKVNGLPLWIHFIIDLS